MATVKVYLYVLLLHFVNLDLVISDDEFYKKFHQTDYKLDLERGAVTYVNKSYGEIQESTFKYNRTHFGTNITLFFKVDVDYDIEVIIQVYKFLSNEYRDFPIHFEINFCKAWRHNVAGIRSCGESCGNINCPMKKNIRYFVCNCLMDASNLPPFIPTGRFKIAGDIIHKKNIIFKSESYVNIYRPILPAKRVG